ncbi:MAG: hypothetical protein ACW967_04155 [Candidatus Hodarchaeales archaeon]|jgi:hypothetical protein
MDKGNFLDYNTFLKAQQLNIDYKEEYEFMLELQQVEDNQKSGSYCRN